VALGARFVSAAWVTAGSTLGMLAADGAVVFRGSYLARLVSPVTLRRTAAALFLILGVAALAGAPAVVIRDSSTAIHNVSRIPSLPTSCG
jgi:putative Ca2+/H+ antiporter (TMEM165/GDT1 family)